jgi:hypothetical protein
VVSAASTILFASRTSHEIPKHLAPGLSFSISFAIAYIDTINTMDAGGEGEGYVEGYLSTTEDCCVCAEGDEGFDLDRAY